MYSAQGRCLCYRCSKGYLISTSVFSLLAQCPLTLGTSPRPLHCFNPRDPLRVFTRPKDAGRDRQRNNCLQIILVHRFGEISYSKPRPNMNPSPLFSTDSDGKTNRTVVSHSQHRTLHIIHLIHFCYGSWDPEIGGSDVVDV